MKRKNLTLTSSTRSKNIYTSKATYSSRTSTKHGITIKNIKRARLSQSRAFEIEVFNLVNRERTRAGVNPLRMYVIESGIIAGTDYLALIARIKSRDMRDNDYFAHQSPTYGSAGNMLTRFRVPWRAWGENIAAGQTTPQAVMTAWMNSAGHRRNILDPNFTHLGVGYASGGRYRHYWTQIFVRL